MAKKYTKSYAERVAYSNGQWREKIRVLHFNTAIFLITNDPSQRILSNDASFMIDGWLRNSPYNFQYQEAKRSHAAFLPYWNLIRERVNWLGWKCQAVRGFCLSILGNHTAQIFIAEFYKQGLEKNNTMAEFFIAEIEQIDALKDAIIEMRKAAEDVHTIDNLNRAYFEHCLPVDPYIEFNLEWVRVGIACWEGAREKIMELMQGGKVDLGADSMELLCDWNAIPGHEITKDYVMGISRMEHI
jgi:hypothetical protein